MAEGVAVGGQVAAGVYDDPDSPPPPDPQKAPKGWTWRRSSSSWQPAQRRARGRGAPAFDAAAAGTDNVSRETGAAAAAQRGPAAAAVTDEDPAPAWARDRDGAGPAVSRETTPGPAPLAPGRIAWEDVPAEVKDDATGLVGLVAIPVLSLLSAIDPYCGGILTDNLDPIVAAALPLMLRSSKTVAYFTDEANDWLLWGKLAVALKPVGQAIVEHHVFRRVRVVRDEQTGVRTIEHWNPAAAAGDPQQPHPQPEAEPYPYAA